MILKALYDYYHRSGDDVAPFGLEYKEIGFIIVIDRCGKFLRFEDRRIDKKSAQRFLVKKSVSRSSAPVANYLYDNCKYVFGYSDKGDMEKIRKYFEVFKAKVKDIYDAFYTANLIYYHMHPYLSWSQSNKAKNKDKYLIGKQMFSDVMLLHEADVKGH